MAATDAWHHRVVPRAPGEDHLRTVVELPAVGGIVGLLIEVPALVHLGLWSRQHLFPEPDAGPEPAATTEGARP